MPKGTFEDKVVVITGGNSGIGYATAQAFIAEGAQVVISGRRAEAVEEAVRSLGPQAHGIVADVSRVSDIERLFAEVGKRYGHIDVVFANAGVGKLNQLGATSEELFDEIMNINLKGLFFTASFASPLLREGGSILINASIAGIKGVPNFSVYSASKAAARSFARTWANDLKDRRIRVISISPGPITTPILGKMGLPAEQVDTLAAHFAAQVPLGRAGTADEVAQAALYLASPQAAFVTGIDFCIDGGMAQV